MKPNVPIIAGEYDGEEALDGYCECTAHVIIVIDDDEPIYCPYCGERFKAIE